MVDRRWSIWDLIYLALLVVAVPAGIFHLVQGRYAQAIMAAAAVIVGVVVLVTGWLRPAEAAAPGAAVAPPAPPVTPPRPHREPERLPSGRLRDWLPLSLLAGFAATGAATIVLVGAWGLVVRPLAGALPQGSTLQRWFDAMAQNVLTERAAVNLPVVLMLHFAAGIGWAILYALFAEPKLSGPGWRRGIVFSLVPWVASIVVFFPLAGAGFLGRDLGAGPLPVIGNLILHLVYGAVLGETYIVQQTLTETGIGVDEEERILSRAERLMGWGILPGFVVGALVALIGRPLIAPEASYFLVAILGGLLGSALGLLVGAYMGLSAAAEGRRVERTP